MGFYSRTIGEFIASGQFDNEESARAMAVDLYHGATLKDASRHAQDINAGNPQNPAVNMIYNYVEHGCEFVLAVFKEEVRKEFDRVTPDRSYRSSPVQRIFNQAYKEVFEMHDGDSSDA